MKLIQSHLQTKVEIEVEDELGNIVSVSVSAQLRYSLGNTDTHCPRFFDGEQVQAHKVGLQSNL